MRWLAALRRVGILVILGLPVLAGCGRGPAAPNASPGHESSVPSAVGSVAMWTCRADQLVVRFRGTQGATGNYLADFLIADVSPRPCVLRSRVTAVLTGGHGARRHAGRRISTPVLLGSHTRVPAADVNVAPGQRLGFLTLKWPTVPNAVLSMGGEGVQCPVPLFVPSAALVIFAHERPVPVGDLGSDGGFGMICGSDLAVMAVGQIRD